MTIALFFSSNAPDINDFKMNYFKVTVKETTAVTNCGSNTDCLPGYYCFNNACSRCPGQCFSCTSATQCSTCSRFTKEWKDPVGKPACNCNIKFN